MKNLILTLITIPLLILSPSILIYQATEILPKEKSKGMDGAQGIHFLLIQPSPPAQMNRPGTNLSSLDRSQATGDRFSLFPKQFSWNLESSFYCEDSQTGNKQNQTRAPPTTSLL